MLLVCNGERDFMFGKTTVSNFISIMVAMRCDEMIDLEPSIWPKRPNGDYMTHLINYEIPKGYHILTRDEYDSLFKEVMEIQDSRERCEAFRNLRTKLGFTSNWYRTGDTTWHEYHDYRMLCFYDGWYQYIEMDSKWNYWKVKMRRDMTIVFL